MNRYVLSPRARRDLDGIWSCSEERWGGDQAEAYVRMLADAFEHLAAEPNRGRSCDDMRAGYFKLNVGSHVVFFRLISNGIDIVRILHRSMNFDRHL